MLGVRERAGISGPFKSRTYLQGVPTAHEDQAHNTSGLGVVVALTEGMLQGSVGNLDQEGQDEPRTAGSYEGVDGTLTTQAKLHSLVVL